MMLERVVQEQMMGDFSCDSDYRADRLAVVTTEYGWNR